MATGMSEVAYVLPADIIRLHRELTIQILELEKGSTVKE